jgi:nicotinamide riboside kinase
MYFSRVELSRDKIFLLPPHGVFVDDHSRFMNHAGMTERQELFEILVKNIKEAGLWDKVTILDKGYYENFLVIKNYVLEVMNR